MESGYLIRKLSVDEMKILSSEEEINRLRGIIKLLSLLDSKAIEIFLLEPFQVFLAEELNGDDGVWHREMSENDTLNEVASEFFGEKMYGNVVILPQGTMK